MRVSLFILLLIAIPQLALATVRPPDEWFDSPANQAEWEAFSPTLIEWEFGERKLMTGTPLESIAGIERFMGRGVEDVSTELGEGEDSALKYDLNLDGRIDQFDLLECGYQTFPNAKETSTAPSTGTNKWCVLRADFSNVNADYSTYTVGYFEDRLFTVGGGANNKPSLHDYYNETSYGALSVIGTVGADGPNGDGWYKGDHTKYWYHTNGGRWLVKEAVLDADPDIDFSQFDVDNDGYVDTLCVYYPGPVMWNGGLHPHRSSGLNISVDGVIVDSYFLSVVDTANDSWLMIIGAHEYGHILGLPDLYDVNGGSAGVGKWSLMADNYNTAQKPPSLDPWSKMVLGWINPIVISDNVTGYSLNNYQNNPDVLKVWTDGIDYSQYFLVANYRQVGTDATRPGEGLMIFHIDDHWYGTGTPGHNQDNTDEHRKHVDVESARGFDDPDSPTGQDPLDSGNSGHADDPWFSGNAAANYTGEFATVSNPNSKAYDHDNDYPLIPTPVRISNISAAGDTMTFDIEVESANAPSCTIDSPVSGTQSGDVTVEVTATPGTDRTISEVRFYCNSAFLGSDNTSPYELTFNSRAIYDGTREIKAVAVDDAGYIDTDTVSLVFSNAATAIPYSDGFEGSGIYNWASYNFFGEKAWEEKDTASDGSHSAGIGSTTEGYDFGEHDNLVSIRFDLSGSTAPIARWRQKYRVAGGENTCKVFATDDDGTTFDLLDTFSNSNLEWHPEAVDLAAYAGSEIHLVFRLDGSSLDSVSGEAGWWIDEFEIHEISGAPNISSITPSDGSTLTGVETITVVATDDEGVLAVDFIIDGTDLIHTDYTDPFTFDWNSDWVFNGSHTFTAIAYDADMQTDTETVNWTTSNTGLSLPWTVSFDADQGNAWRTIDHNGGGQWHWLSNAGYSSSGGMRFSRPGQSTHDNMDNDWYISPTLSVGGVTDPGFGWVHKFDIEYNYDYGRVYITTDLNTWNQLDVYSQTNQGWRANGERLDSYIGDNVKVAFFFESDGGLVEGGWWVDELEVAGAAQITGVSPASVTNGETITITGTGFGSGAAVDFPRVLVSGYQATVTNWSDTSITATVPSQSASGNIVVVRHGIESDGYPISIKLPPPSIGGLGQL